MKMAYVSNSRFPSERAHAVQIVQMCNAFAEQGHEVSLLVTNRPTHITQSPEEFYGTQLAFSVVRIAVPDIAGNVLNFSKLFWPLAYTFQRVIFAVLVLRYIKNRNFNVIYGRDEWVLALLSYRTRIAICWESHEAKYSFFVRRLLHHCKNFVVISEGIRDFYVQKGVHIQKILVAHDAVDTSFFEETLSKKDAREVLGIVCEKPIVMYIGGLDRWKGVDTLFEASESSYEEVSTYIIGGKEHQIERYRLKYPHVHFLGHRPYKELRDNQQAADMLVIPNTAKNKLSAEYTSPLKLFAHMTSKIPIVASDITSITNVLSKDQAFFFEADNATSLSEVVLEIIQNPKIASAKAFRAYELSKEYTWNKRATSIIAFCSRAF
jgi:glycosyltransferase involved in cell wall biosynthesis